MRKDGEQAQEVFALQGDAPGSRGEAAPRDVHEDRASAPGDAPSRVVAEHNDRVIEAVVAPKPLCAGAIGQWYAPVVVPVAGGVAPSVAFAQRLDGQRCGGAPQPVRPVIDPDCRPKSPRGCPVALAFEGADAAFTKRRREM